MKSTLHFLALLLAIAVLPYTLPAQNVVWNEDFSDGSIPAGWTSQDASGNGGIWTWCDDPIDANGAGCVVNWADYQDQHGPFASATATNGFMVMDSDFLGGLANPPHIVRLTTAPIDCSSLSEVWVKSENLIGVWEYTTTDNAVLRVSTDGVNWTAYNLFDIAPGMSGNEPGSIRWTLNPGFAVTDISAVAAGQSTVYLQWSWTGNYEYYWLLDDVVLYDADPTSLFFAAHDMQVNNDFFAVAPNLIWPLEMVEPIGFLADISNQGLITQSNVSLNLTIEDPNGNVVFTEDLQYGSITPDSIAQNVPFAGTFEPAELGVYTGTYTVSADSTDLNPDNNSQVFEFLMSDTLFAKENGINLVTRPADDSWDVGEAWSWAYGNYYYVTNANDQVFKHVFFAIAAEASQAGENLSVNIYKWTDTNADEQADPGERTLAAQMLYTIEGDEIGEDIIALPVTTLLGETVALEDNTQYLVMVEYSTDVEGTTIEMGMSDAVDYGAMIFRTGLDGAPRYGSFLGINTPLDEEPYSSLGFGWDLVPAVSISFGEPSSVREEILLDASLSVFPNPANSQVTLGMHFHETMKNVTIQLFDINGKLLETRRMDNVKNQDVNFNAQSLTPGSYFMKVTTEKGTRTATFKVQR
ncbi:MAG: T9SS type A sorting domain-containing protein [Saprospiraceae bacterium]